MVRKRVHVVGERDEGEVEVSGGINGHKEGVGRGKCGGWGWIGGGGGGRERVT